MTFRMSWIGHQSSWHCKASKVSFKASLFGFAFLFFLVWSVHSGSCSGSLQTKGNIPPLVSLLANCWILFSAVAETSRLARLFFWSGEGMNRPDGARVRNQCYWVLSRLLRASCLLLRPLIYLQLELESIYNLLVTFTCQVLPGDCSDLRRVLNGDRRKSGVFIASSL